MQFSSGELSASGSSSASGAESSPPSEGGDTEPVDDDDDNDDSSISESPPCSQVPSVVSESKSDWPLVVNQAIVKGVFGHVLNRDEIVNILKKKFSVQPRNLTNLKPTELTSVLARKLVRYDYCRVKEVVKNKGDITVLKEIAF